MKKILLILMSAMLCLAADTSLYFVQITDTHWGSPGNLRQTQRIVDAINDLPMKISCVVHTGDIVDKKCADTAIVDSGISILKQLQPDYYVLQGNHDSHNKKLMALYSKLSDPVQVIRLDGVSIVAVNSIPLWKGDSAEGNRILQTLEDTLKILGKQPVILAQHTPSVPDFYGNTMHSGWSDEFAMKWKKLLNSHTVVAAISGHFHRDELHWIGNIPLYVSAPVDKSWGRQSSFRLFEYSEGKLGYRTIYVNSDE